MNNSFDHYCKQLFQGFLIFEFANYELQIVYGILEPPNANSQKFKRRS